MATVLVSAAGGGHGIGAIQSLQRRTDHHVVGVDMDPSAPGLILADDGYQIPAEDAVDWPEVIASIIREHDVDAVILHRDAELQRIEEVKHRINVDTVFVSGNERTIKMTADTLFMAKELKDNLQIPETHLATEYEQASADLYPAVVKPRQGQGNSIGSGVEIVEGPEAVESYLTSSNQYPDKLLVQKYIKGAEYTSDVLVTQENRLLSVVTKEAVSESPYRRVTRDAPQVAAACEEAFKTIQPGGVMNVQHVVSQQTGEPYLIEINPRFSHSSCLTVAAGIDGYDLLVRDAVGEFVDSPSNYTPDLHMVEHTQPLFVPERRTERSFEPP